MEDIQDGLFSNNKVEKSQSASSINSSRSSKMGNSRLRKSLYMPEIAATRYNPLMADLYTLLLAKGKPKKLAIAAVSSNEKVIGDCLCCSKV